MSMEAAERAAAEILLHLQEIMDNRTGCKISRAQVALAERDGLQPAMIGSTGLCREASMFAVAVLEEAGWTGWRMVNGKFDLEDIENIPLDIHDYHVHGETEAFHTWVVHEKDGILMDLTADQFGYEVCPEDEPLVLPLERAFAWKRDGRQQDWRSDPDVTGAVENWLGFETCEDASAAHTITDPDVLDLIEVLREIHLQHGAPVPAMA